MDFDPARYSSFGSFRKDRHGNLVFPAGTEKDPRFIVTNNEEAQHALTAIEGAYFLILLLLGMLILPAAYIFYRINYISLTEFILIVPVFFGLCHAFIKFAFWKITRKLPEAPLITREEKQFIRGEKWAWLMRKLRFRLAVFKLGLIVYPVLIAIGLLIFLAHENQNKIALVSLCLLLALLIIFAPIIYILKGEKKDLDHPG